VKRILLPVLLSCASGVCRAQENYQIQVYGTQTQKKESAIFELHSNYTLQRKKAVVNEVRPSFIPFTKRLRSPRGSRIFLKSGFIYSRTAAMARFSLIKESKIANLPDEISSNVPVLS
jgi:hypothetical protein